MSSQLAPQALQEVTGLFLMIQTVSFGRLRDDRTLRDSYFPIAGYSTKQRLKRESLLVQGSSEDTF